MDFSFCFAPVSAMYKAGPYPFSVSSRDASAVRSFPEDRSVPHLREQSAGTAVLPDMEKEKPAEAAGSQSLNTQERESPACSFFSPRMPMLITAKNGKAAIMAST